MKDPKFFKNFLHFEVNQTWCMNEWSVERSPRSKKSSIFRSTEPLAYSICWLTHQYHHPVCSYWFSVILALFNIGFATLITLPARKSSCRQQVNFIQTFLKNFPNLNFHCSIWIRLKKCIQMSTNKPSIGRAVLELACLIKKNVNFGIVNLKRACKALALFYIHFIT